MTTRTTTLALTLLALGGSARGQVLEHVPEIRLSCLVEHDLVIRGAGRVKPGLILTEAAFLWTGGVVTMPGAAHAVAATPDGMMYVGWSSTDGGTALRWHDQGWSALPAPGFSDGTWLPTGMSDDGSVVVGYGPVDGAGPYDYVGGVWRDGVGTGVLTVPILNGYSEGLCVSGDGVLIGGTRRSVGGTIDRATLFDNGTMTSVIPASWPGATTTPSALTTLDDDGQFGAGSFGDGIFRWSAAGGAELVATGIGSDLVARAISDDGKSIAGHRQSFPFDRAWLWTEAQGFRYVEDLAEQLALDPGVSASQSFGRVAGLSGDGRTLAGAHQSYPDGSWILELPEGGVGEVVPLGQGSGGTAPKLEVFGAFAGGSPTSLVVSNLQPSSTGYLVIGFSQLLQPFKGGTLIPSPDLVVEFPTFFGGPLPLANFPWPDGVPSGSAVIMQLWSQDSGSAFGLASSSAKMIITP